jgi:hypothetical protein
MTFDRDRDGRVVKGELPERMQNLLAADASGDAALDSAEIRTLAAPPRPVAAAATVPGIAGFGGGGGYTFGDQVSLSTRSHVEGALDDLRLPASTHQRALAIVRPFMDRLEADASAALLKEVEGVMPPAQFNAFKSAIERQMSAHVPSGPAITRPDGFEVSNFVFRRGADPALIINAFGLPAERARAAQAAFDGFKARIRPGDADRAALLSELKDLLSEEERENFGAALQRRPLVKAGGVMAGIAPGIAGLQRRIEAGVVVEGPAVFTTPFPSERRVVEP